MELAISIMSKGTVPVDWEVSSIVNRVEKGDTLEQVVRTSNVSG